jgi:hypothetical protein
MYPIRDIVVTRHISTNGDATDQIFLIAPFDCILVSVEARWGVASSSGTLAVEKVPDGTAVGSGTDLLTSTMSLASTANTKVVGAISTAIGVNRIAEGEGVSLDFAGTLTNLVDLIITMVIRQEKLRA